MTLRVHQGMPFPSGVVFRDEFLNYSTVSDNGGIVVASTISKGISPTGVTGRVTYNGTEACLINSTQMTLVARIKTSASNNAAQTILFAKSPSALNANQWYLTIEANRILRLYVASSAADVANYVSLNAALSVATEYTIHATYSAGTVAFYLQGAVAASTVTGAIPASLRAGTAKITVLNLDGGSTLAPATDTVGREVRAHARAFSASEVSDDYANMAYRGVTP